MSREDLDGRPSGIPVWVHLEDAVDQFLDRELLPAQDQAHAPVPCIDPTSYNKVVAPADDDFPDPGEWDAGDDGRIEVGAVDGGREERGSRRRTGFTMRGEVSIGPIFSSIREGSGSLIRRNINLAAAVAHGEVRFMTTGTRAAVPIGRVLLTAAETLMRWFEAIEKYWMHSRRPVVVITGLYEIWSVGIWLGFITEADLSGTLTIVVYIDFICNIVYLMDNILLLAQFYMEERRKRRVLDKGQKTPKQRPRKDSQLLVVRTSLKEGFASSAVAADSRDAGPRADGAALAGRDTSTLQGLASGGHQHRVTEAYVGLALGVGMIPLLIDLYHLLQNQRYMQWEVAIILIARATRMWWGSRQCLRLLNEQEIEVYVDIKMHGTQGSSWNRARILAKQVLLIAFFGHWFGCISYALRGVDDVLLHDIRVHPDTTRDFFISFKEEGRIPFETHANFWQNYILTVAKGFNLAKTGMPEKLVELLLNTVITMCLLIMKAYCIGNFFKYHQKRELEVHRFRSLMSSVQQYLDLYEVPPSLRKAVLSHFKFQQANHRKLQTLEVIGRLPLEVQKKLREQEVLPTVVERNAQLFGIGTSRDFCIQIAVLLAPRYLEPSEVIFVESEVPRELIFLESGAVALWRGTAAEGNRTEQIRYVRADRKDDPTALGAVSIILGAVHFHSARVRAGVEAVTLNLPREGYEELKLQFPEQHDQLVQNVLQAYGAEGESAIVATDENERFMASQQSEVRRTLRERQEHTNATFTYAASNGDIKLVQEVLRKRVDPNIANYDRRSAMHLAASDGMAEVLEALLEAKGDANLRDRWGSTPMQDALRNGYVSAAKMVQKHGGRLELSDPARLLRAYASEGNTIAMQQLINFRVDCNAGDYDARTALHLSASEGHLPVVTFLTAQKADVNVKDRWGSTPIQDAIQGGFATVSSHLHTQGGRLDSEFVANHLCDAASAGDVPRLKMLYETGVDVNEGDYDARTALHLAAAEGQVLALHFLVNMAQAAHSPVDRWGSTPLQDALTGGHTFCVKMLLASGAQLGRSADRATQQTVEELATEMGFRTRGLTIFSETSTRLRRQLHSHMSMVEQGKARADIFVIEDAHRFDMQVVIASFGKINVLRSQARWLIDLLQPLGPACASIQDLLRLVRDGEALVKDAKVWTQASMLNKAGKRLKKGRRFKESPEMAFHSTFLSTRAYAPALQRLIGVTAARLLAKARQLQRQAEARGEASRSAPLPSVSALAVAELLAELGGDRVPHLHSGGPRRFAGVSEAAHADLRRRLEDTARRLLPDEHTLWSTCHGALKLYGAGARAADAAGEPGARPLQEWLAPATCGRRAAASEQAGPPPVLPPGTPPEEAFGRLWPSFYGGERVSWHSPSAQEPAHLFDRSLCGAEGVSYLFACELAFLAVLALVLEGWERAALIEQDVGNNLASGMRSQSSDDVAGLLDDDQRLALQDFQKLGKLFRSAAKACRGTRQEAHSLAKKMEKLGASEFEALDTGSPKGLLLGHELSHTSSEAPRKEPERIVDDAEEEGDADVEKLPISLARILSMQDYMSVDELAVLMDADLSSNIGTPGQRSATGEIPRERFALNLLRWILEYDDMQNEVMAVADTNKQEAEDRAAAMRELESPPPRQHARRSERKEAALAELYEEVADMEQALSNEVPEQQAAASERTGGGARAASTRDSQREALDGSAAQNGCCDCLRGLATASRVSTVQQEAAMTGTRRSFIRESGIRDPGSGPRLARFSCRAATRWVVRYFGAEGAERRKRQRIAKKFKELDDDGEGIGTADVAQILAVAFKHTLGTEGELRWAYRVFELLNKADFGDLVTLPEMLSILPTLTEEIKAQQRKNQNQSRREVSSDAAVGPLARFASGFVITPESPFVHAWDRVRRVVVIYYMLEVPTRFSFLSRNHLAPWATTAHFAASVFADVFMALNVILTFFRAFVHPTLGVVSAFQDIRMHYVFSVFPVDFVACLPIDWWLPEGEDENTLLARPRAGARLLKLLHLHHLRSGHHAHLDEVGFGTTASSLSVSVFILAHLLACVWWLLGTRFDEYDWTKAFDSPQAFYPEDDERGSWTYTYAHRPGENPIGDPGGGTPYWWQYLISFYDTLSRVIASTPAGDIDPRSWIELAWIIAMVFLNIAVAGYCDGILVDKVIAGDEQTIEAEAMRRILDEYLAVAELPNELVQEVRTSAQLSDKMMAWKRMENTIAELPHSLQQRIARRTVVPRLFAQDIVQHCSDSFVVELGVHCRILPVGRGHILTRPGEPSSQLFILNFGRVGVLDRAGAVISDTTLPNMLLEDMPFVFGLKHNVQLTVLDETQLTVLQRGAFVAACRAYPEDAMTLRRNVMQAARDLTGELAPANNSTSEAASSVDDDMKSRAESRVSKGSKGSSSYASVASRASENNLNEFLRNSYMRELKAVAQKLQQEETVARQDVIFKFIQKAADGEVAVVTDMLSKRELSVDGGDTDQRTALHLAVCNGHMQIVKLLVEKFGASVQVKDRFGHTPLDDAVRERKVDILRYLLSRGALHQADANTTVQLCQAAHSNDLATLTLLLEDLQVNPNSAGYGKRTALHLGASEGHLAVVELLVNTKGIDLSPVDWLGNTPLEDAMRHKHVLVRRFLHAKGAKMGDRNLGVVLCSLAYANDVDGLMEFADSEVSLGQGDYDARTALHLAASEDRLAAATYLLVQAKVDPNPLDRFLNTPLDDAIREGHHSMEALLRATGGLRGSDPSMAKAVEMFKEEKKVQEAQMSKRKLEKEVQSSDVSTLLASLKRFRDHPTLELDVQCFVLETANFRDLLLRLLSWSACPPEDADWSAAQVQEGGPQLMTKVYREQLLERTCTSLEYIWERLVETLDGEVMPWLASLTKAEARVLRVLVPELRPAVTRTLELLRGAARLRKTVARLWSEKGAGGGAYECLPVGLLMQRPQAELARRVRLEAEVLLWATGTSAGQLGDDGGRIEATAQRRDATAGSSN